MRGTLHVSGDSNNRLETGMNLLSPKQIEGAVDKVIILLPGLLSALDQYIYSVSILILL